MSTTAIVGATVIPMDRPDVLGEHTVVTADGLIVEVGPEDQVTVPSDAAVIDGTGAFLMPGLADMHTHLARRDTDATQLLLYLAQGVTTVRSMSGAPQNPEWRDRVEQGDLIGPTILTSGLTIVDNLPRDLPADVLDRLAIFVPDSAEAAAAEVRRQADGWPDFVKLYDGLSEPHYLAAVEAANEAGIWVAGHLLDESSLETLLSSGLNEVAHLDELNVFHWLGFPGEPGFAVDHAAVPATAALMSANDVAVVSNVVADEILADLIFDPDEVLSRPEYDEVRPETVEMWRREGRHLGKYAEQGPYRRDVELPFFLTLLRALHDEGVTITIGTDTSQFLEGSVQSNIHRELELLTEAGLSTFDALRAGTRNAAAVVDGMGRDGRFGTVTPGNRADLLLLRANPLEDVSNTRGRVGCMVRGTWRTQGQLDDLVADFVATY